MDKISLMGYLASVFVASSFYMKTMIPLRWFAIASNLCFISYALLESPVLYPVLFLHLFLFPLNLIRLHQIHRLIRDVRSFEKNDFSLEWLIPYMSKVEYKEGSILFHRGDRADKLYIIQKGSIKLPEIDHVLHEGEIIGEVGTLSEIKQRSTSAVCIGKVQLFSLDENQLMILCYQNPKFALYLTRTIIKRLSTSLH